MPIQEIITNGIHLTCILWIPRLSRTLIITAEKESIYMGHYHSITRLAQELTLEYYISRVKMLWSLIHLAIHKLIDAR